MTQISASLGTIGGATGLPKAEVSPQKRGLLGNKVRICQRSQTAGQEVDDLSGTFGDYI